MSKISCEACSDLREYAPEFVMSGVTDNVATSLKNNTGLNPSLSALHKDCEDLNDVNDCLIGRMVDEIEAHDVCDWKEVMSKFFSNLYETLKAIIAAICGLWTKVESLCATVDNILSIIKGSGAAGHKFAWTQAGRAMFHAESPFQDQYFFLTLEAEIRRGGGCTTNKRLAVMRIGQTYTAPIYPQIFRFRGENVQRGVIIGTLRKSEVVPQYMPESIWTDIMRGHMSWNVFTLNGDTIIRMGVVGYIVINGVEMNVELKDTYGPDVLCLRIMDIVGLSLSGGANADYDQLSIFEV